MWIHQGDFVSSPILLCFSAFLVSKHHVVDARGPDACGENPKAHLVPISLEVVQYVPLNVRRRLGDGKDLRQTR